MHVPATADYVCVNCGRAYTWEGTPPTLAVLTALATEADDDGDDDVA
jgi:DNA-directed RNA polymerase subunit RPC12/RpoP